MFKSITLAIICLTALPVSQPTQAMAASKRMFGNTDKIDRFIPTLVIIPPTPLKKAGWFHTEEEKTAQESEDRLNYLAKEISLNAPHRTIKANTRPSAR